MEMPRITIGEVRARIMRGERLTFMDARTLPEFEQERLPGAMHRSDAALDGEKLVVTYCSSQDELQSGMLAWELRNAGRSNVYVLKGGLSAWMDSGLQTEHARQAA